MSDLTKDEGCNCPRPSQYLVKHSAGCYERRIAALERENAVLEENAIRFREERDRLRQSQSHEPKTGLSSEEHQMIARLCDTSHEAVAAYERRFQIRGSLFGPIDNEMIALRDASARMIVAAINGGRKPPETNKLPTPDEGNDETVGRAIAETTRNTSNTNQHRE